MTAEELTSITPMQNGNIITFERIEDDNSVKRISITSVDVPSLQPFSVPTLLVITQTLSEPMSVMLNQNYFGQ